MEQNISIQSQSGITSISQLPNSDKSNNNLTLNTNELNQQMVNNSIQNTPNQNTSNQIIPNQNIEIQNNNSNYNELVTQLQHASNSGATCLPSRDIPINTNVVNNDVQIKPNYIPQQNTNKDYINNFETPENLINENKIKQTYTDNLELFYNELQIPLLLSTLYFLFQLPFFKKTCKKILPFLFASDGNINLNGNLFNSVLFSGIFYILFKLINKLSLTI
tara:strand:- start:60 stop:719 length:660 start_codon:yes stop_codon:yes gene_type:complete